jgi:hypothetical protein
MITKPGGSWCPDTAKLAETRGEIAFQGASREAIAAGHDLVFEGLVEAGSLAESYARSLTEAAWRGDRSTVEVHLRQTPRLYRCEHWHFQADRRRRHWRMSASALIAGKPFSVANIRVGVGEEATWWSVTDFAEAADDLLELEAGDAISISGPFTSQVYAKDGVPPRVSFRIIFDCIASPRLGKRKEAA